VHRDRAGRHDVTPQRDAEAAELISLLTRPDLPDGFTRWTVVIPPGGDRAVQSGEWAGALVLVSAGELEAECRVQGILRFSAGDVLVLGVLPLVALRNPGHEPVHLIAVRPAKAGTPPEGLRVLRGGRSWGGPATVPATSTTDDIGAGAAGADPSLSRWERMDDRTVAELRDRFRALHTENTFVMPNAWDVGSARLLAHLGFSAVATTSSGFAASLGRGDQCLTRDECVAHADLLARSVPVPVNVDAERCYADDVAGVRETVELVGRTAAAGISIEDYDPVAGTIDQFETAVERVATVVEVARRHGLVVTARAENHLYGINDLADTITRLRAYREAGADVVYAPGPRTRDEIAALVGGVDAPHNVLLRPDGPGVDELRALGVRRISTGGALAFTAYGAAAAAARGLLDGDGRIDDWPQLPQQDRDSAFG
jgi:2-methylisocitrate lyase-like PEP mutase family enzyme